MIISCYIQQLEGRGTREGASNLTKRGGELIGPMKEKNKMKTSTKCISSKQLTDTDHLLAELSGLLHEGGSEHRHGHGQHSGHQGATVLGVTVLATEAVSLEVGDTLGNSLLSGHVVSGPGQDVSALLAGPVTDTLQQLHLLYYFYYYLCYNCACISLKKYVPHLQLLICKSTE